MGKRGKRILKGIRERKRRERKRLAVFRLVWHEGRAGAKAVSITRQLIAFSGILIDKVIAHRSCALDHGITRPGR